MKPDLGIQIILLFKTNFDSLICSIIFIKHESVGQVMTASIYYIGKTRGGEGFKLFKLPI